MRESPKAMQAWNDYLAMGAERSLDKLLARYLSATYSVPTRREMSLKNWSVQHCWQQRLAAIAEQERQAIVAKGIADKQNRVDAYNDRWHRMKQVIAERATSEDLQDIAGGKTGLIVHNVKGVGKGDDFRLIDVYEVDTGLLKELREHEKQAAQELGQWVEKNEHSGPDGGPIEVTDARERLASRLASIAARAGAPINTSKPDATGSGGIT